MAAALPGVPEPSETKQSYVLTLEESNTNRLETFDYASSSLFPLSLLKLLSCRCFPSASTRLPSAVFLPADINAA